jgi:hypothetical protein
MVTKENLLGFLETFDQIKILLPPDRGPHEVQMTQKMKTNEFWCNNLNNAQVSLVMESHRSL